MTHAPAPAHNAQRPTRLLPAALRRTALCLALATALPPHAAIAAQTHAIAAGPLGAALSTFAEQAGITLVFDTAQVAGLRSGGLHGSHGVENGLARLLAGTGLEAVRESHGGYTLRQRPAVEEPVVLPEIRVSADAGSIYGPLTEGTGSYTTRDVSIAKGQAIREIPQSISVVTRQQIEDQNLVNLTDVLDKATGITVVKSGATSSSYGNDSKFYSRGFAVSNLQLDGGAATAEAFGGWAGSISQLDMAQFDHIEFLRGIDGLFSSTGEPGGTINLVRKRPQAEHRGTASVMVGRWDNYRLETDVTGTLAMEGALRGRLGIATEDRRYFYDTAKDRRKLIYAAIEADLAPDTLLTVGGSYQRNDGVPFAGGLPRHTNGADLSLPRSTSLTADWNTVKDESRLFYAKLEHSFNDEWKLSLNIDRLQIERDAMGLFSSGGADPVTGLGAYWFAFPARTGSTRTTFNANAKGTFDLLGRRHELTAGTDFEKGTAYSYQADTDINGTELDVFNIIRPANPGRNPEYNWWDYEQERRAIYGALKLSLTDPLKLIVGGRYSRYKFDSTGRFDYTPISNVISFKESGIFTPYAGLTYALTPEWTAYASYAETYLPQYQQLAGPLPGTALDPMTSKNYELGLKGDLIPSRLNASFALYRINRNDEAILDPAYPQSWGSYNCCYTNSGKVVSQGIEAEVSGEVLSGLQVVAGYTFNSNERKDSDSDSRYSSITPRHLLKVWSNYQLPGSAHRWKIGAGVQLQSRHYVSGTATTYDPATGQWDGGSRPFRFSQSGYAVWSARVDYRIAPDWSIALNVTNLFDKHYYQTVGTSRNGNFYGEPLSATLTLRGAF